jgi:hypothetical protein
MIVKTPIGYGPDIIIISILNGQSVNQRQQIDIVGGQGMVDLTMFPDGFFSAYGGPYTLQFFDVESYELLNFVATNGISYTCIEFEFQNGSEVDSITISA